MFEGVEISATSSSPEPTPETGSSEEDFEFSFGDLESCVGASVEAESHLLRPSMPSKDFSSSGAGRGFIFEPARSEGGRRELSCWFELLCSAHRPGQVFKGVGASSFMGSAMCRVATFMGSFTLDL